MTTRTTTLNGSTVPMFSPGTCSTCGCGPSVPYRRIVNGVIVEGCVDRTHSGHLGTALNTSNWHERKSAKALRRSAKAFQGPVRA